MQESPLPSHGAPAQAVRGVPVLDGRVLSAFSVALGALRLRAQECFALWRDLAVAGPVIVRPAEADTPKRCSLRSPGLRPVAASQQGMTSDGLLLTIRLLLSSGGPQAAGGAGGPLFAWGCPPTLAVRCFGQLRRDLAAACAKLRPAEAEGPAGNQRMLTFGC
jgi:hypothetical protein